MISSERQELKAPASQTQSAEGINSTHQLAKAMFLGLEESTDTEGFTKPEFGEAEKIIMRRNFRLQRRRNSRANFTPKHH